MEDYEKDDFGDGTKISDYNSALFINQRINNLWVDANKHKRTGAFSDWNADLDSMWCELAGDVDKNSNEDKEFKEINLRIKAVNPIINWGVQTMNKKTPDIHTKKAKQYGELMDKELFLRRLQNKQGKGTKYRDDMADYMDG